MAESDNEFLDRVEDFFDGYSGIPKEVVARLFALARKGAAEAKMKAEWSKLADECDLKDAHIAELEYALRRLLAASERHIFSTECQEERATARAALAPPAQQEEDHD